MMRRLRAGAGMALFAAGTLPLALAHVVLRRTGPRLRMVVPGLWHRLVNRSLGLKVHRIGSLSEKRPLLVVANHVSWTDIMVVGSSAPVTFVAKADMITWPGIGWLARSTNTIFVERERRSRTGEQADEISQRLAAGEAVVLFPEGTTADGNHLLPFKSSLFAAAQRALDSEGIETVHIQPVAIGYTHLQGIPMPRSRRAATAAWIGDADLAPHVVQLLGEGAMDVTIEFGQAISFDGTQDRKTIARSLQEKINAMTRRHLRGQPKL